MSVMISLMSVMISLMSVMISLMSVRSAALGLALGQRGESVRRGRQEVHGRGGGRRELIELRLDPLER